MTQVEPRTNVFGSGVPETTLPPFPTPRHIISDTAAIPQVGMDHGREQLSYGTDNPTAQGSDWSYDVFTPNTESDTFGNAPEIDLTHPETFFEAIVADPSLSDDKKLQIIEATRVRILEAADSRLQSEEAGADYIKTRANQQADLEKERVSRENSALTRQADERASQERAAATAKSEAMKAAAEGQIQVATYHKGKIEKDLAERMAKASPHKGVEPGMWPEPLEKAILDFNADKYRKSAANKAVGIIRTAEREANRIIDDAERTCTRQWERVAASVDAMLATQYQRARLMIESARTEHRRVHATVAESVDRAQELIRHEANERRRIATDPALSLSGAGSVRTWSLPVDVDRLTRTGGKAKLSTTATMGRGALETTTDPIPDYEQAEGDTVASPPQEERGKLKFLRSRKALISGVIVSALAAGGIVAAVESGKNDKPAIEQQIERDSQAPKWAAQSLQAWQKMISQASEDPRIAVGKENYIVNSDTLGGGQEKIVYSLMALTSLGDPKYVGGVLYFNPDVMQSAAKEIGVNFDPANPDPKLTFVIGEHVINKQIRDMLSDPAKRQAYAKDHNSFYTDFGTAYRESLAKSLWKNTTDDNFVKLFAILVSDSTAAKSPTFDDLYKAYKADYDTAVSNQQSTGIPLK